MSDGKRSSTTTVVASVLGLAAVRLIVRAASPHSDLAETTLIVAVVVVLGGLAIGACVLIWRMVKSLVGRIDRALPDRDRDRRGELEAAYMKASLERWVQTGTSGDRALDVRFETMRHGAPVARAAIPAPQAPTARDEGSADDPRTLALVAALEKQNAHAGASRR